VPKYLQPLMERIQRGDIDPSFLITHRLTIDDAASGYRTFRYDQEECIKVVMQPS